jgi:hypothetical protein
MSAYGGLRQGSSIWPDAITNGMTDAQLAVLEPPYHPRLGRPMLSVDEETGSVVVESGGEGDSVAELKDKAEQWARQQREAGQDKGGEQLLPPDVKSLVDSARAKALVDFSMERGMHRSPSGESVNDIAAAMREMRSSRGTEAEAEMGLRRKQRALVAAYEAGALTAAELGVAVARLSTASGSSKL